MTKREMMYELLKTLGYPPEEQIFESFKQKLSSSVDNGIIAAAGEYKPQESAEVHARDEKVYYSDLPTIMRGDKFTVLRGKEKIKTLIVKDDFFRVSCDDGPVTVTYNSLPLVKDVDQDVRLSSEATRYALRIAGGEAMIKIKRGDRLLWSIKKIVGPVDILQDPSQAEEGVIYLIKEPNIVQLLCPCGCGKLQNIRQNRFIFGPDGITSNGWIATVGETRSYRILQNKIIWG